MQNKKKKRTQKVLLYWPAQTKNNILCYITKPQKDSLLISIDKAVKQETFECQICNVWVMQLSVQAMKDETTFIYCPSERSDWLLGQHQTVSWILYFTADDDDGEKAAGVSMATVTAGYTSHEWK